MYVWDCKVFEKQKIDTLFSWRSVCYAVVDRFGTKDIQYARVDETHFSVTAKVEISEQFFGWILGFGSKAKLVYPEDVKVEFSSYLDRIREMY